MTRVAPSSHVLFAENQLAVRFIEEIDFDYAAPNAHHGVKNRSNRTRPRASLPGPLARVQATSAMRPTQANGLRQIPDGVPLRPAHSYDRHLSPQRLSALEE